MAYTFDENTVSDLYKDAYGVRPRAEFWAEWKEMCDDEKHAEWDRMCEHLEETMELERLRAQRSYEQWYRHIEKLMDSAKLSHGDAIRWDMQAQDATGDIGYYCYRWGLSYSTEDEINEMLKG